MSTQHIVIVGAGDCGARAALRVRELDADVAITLVGEEIDPPYERPPLSKSVLTDDAEPPTIAAAESLVEQSIDWVSGSPAIRLDADRRTVELADGRLIGYDRLLIATGSRARQLPIAGAELATTVRSLSDARALRAKLTPGSRALIIGGGFIGLETAASARRCGVEVAVVEFAHELMSRVVPAPVAEIVRQRHEAEGVHLRTGLSVRHLKSNGRGVSVTVVLDDDSSVDADVVIAGVGAIPNTELAATAGLSIVNGVAVHANLRTTDANIYAAGDCCSVPHPLYDGRRIRLEAWRNAVAHAEIAAANLLGADEEADAVPSFWSDQYDLTMNVVGLHAAATSHVSRRSTDGHEVLFGIGSDGRVVSASGVAPGTTLARDIRLAELLIAGRATPSASQLSDASVDLRSLLGR